MRESYKQLMEELGMSSDKEELEIPYMSKRYICSVLDEMRAANNNIAPDVIRRHMGSLVEEVQTLANRMELGLSQTKDLKTINEEIKRGVKILNELNKEIKEKRNEVQTSGETPVAESTEGQGKENEVGDNNDCQRRCGRCNSDGSTCGRS